jgi:hypothetical protein
MPPEKIYLPPTLGEFAKMAAKEEEKYLPLLRSLQFHQLIGLHQALTIALEEIKPAIKADDNRRQGYPVPGTTIGRR